MRSRHVRAAIATVASTALVIACSSVPELTFSDDGGTVDPDSSSTFPDGAPKPDGSIDAAVDTGPCVPSGPENCEDGKDNDCNGKIDCEDDACKPTHQCVDAPPTGWDLVAFNASSRADSCPTGYGTAADVKSVGGTGSGGTCACTCAPTSGTCGTFGVTLSDTNGCGNAVNTQAVAVNGNCTALAAAMNVPLNPDYYGTATAPTPPATCGGTATKSNVPAIASGRMCPSPAGLGKGCPNNGACVRKPTSFPQVCVTQTGQTTCPPVYTQSRSAGTEASADNRDCNACNCNPSAAACGQTVQLFDQTDCTLGGNKKTTGALSAACSSIPDKNFNATHYRVNNAGNGCAVAGVFSPTVIGNIAWDQQRTICCKP